MKLIGTRLLAAAAMFGALSAAGADWETCGRLGSVAATYSLEHVGATTHTYTWKDFKGRYEKHFGMLSL